GARQAPRRAARPRLARSGPWPGDRTRHRGGPWRARVGGRLCEGRSADRAGGAWLPAREGRGGGCAAEPIAAPVRRGPAWPGRRGGTPGRGGLPVARPPRPPRSKAAGEIVTGALTGTLGFIQDELNPEIGFITRVGV